MKFYEEIPGLAKFEDNLLNQINNQEAIIDTLKGRLEAKDKQASSGLRIIVLMYGMFVCINAWLPWAD